MFLLMPYPLLISSRPHRDHDYTEETCYGLALSIQYKKADEYQDSGSGIIWKSLWSPCINCEELIRLFHGNIDNFKKETELAEAPP
jgi:hypothetical protein